MKEEEEGSGIWKELRAIQFVSDERFPQIWRVKQRMHGRGLLHAKVIVHYLVDGHSSTAYTGDTECYHQFNPI